jgi:hypothetical protein
VARGYFCEAGARREVGEKNVNTRHGHAGKGRHRLVLVMSDKGGIAMRSQPLDLGGTPIHRPGNLIDKALDPLEKGVGEILVLLSLQ